MTDPKRKAYQIEFHRLRRKLKKCQDGWNDLTTELKNIWTKEKL